LRDKPPPTKASPEIGSQKVNRGPPYRKRLAGVVTRGVVLISSVLLCGPLLRLGIGFCPEAKEQVVDAGSPDPHEIETDSGNGPVGVINKE
jgi:hypothetical protein